MGVGCWKHGLAAQTENGTVVAYELPKARSLFDRDEVLVWILVFGHRFGYLVRGPVIRTLARPSIYRMPTIGNLI